MIFNIRSPFGVPKICYIKHLSYHPLSYCPMFTVLPIFFSKWIHIIFCFYIIFQVESLKCLWPLKSASLLPDVWSACPSASSRTSCATASSIARTVPTSSRVPPPQRSRRGGERGAMKMTLDKVHFSRTFLSFNTPQHLLTFKWCCTRLPSPGLQNNGLVWPWDFFLNYFRLATERAIARMHLGLLFVSMSWRFSFFVILSLFEGK